MDEEDTKFCSNCKRQISAANFMIHEMHCKRHIVLCDRCNEPVHHSEIEQHMQDSHAKINCDKCGMAMEKDQLQEHEKNICLKKKQKCLFCELEVTRGEFDNHTDFCGSRTEQCLKCQQYIMLKDQIEHEASNCTYPAPKPSNVSAPQNNNSVSDPFLFNQEENYVDPFTFEEISRMLNQTVITRPVGRVTTNPTGVLPKDRNVSMKTNNVDRTQNQRMNKPSSSVNMAVANTKKPLGTKRLIGGNDRRKLDTNRQREMGAQSVNRYGATGCRVTPQPTRDIQKKGDLDALIQELEKPRKQSEPQAIGTSNFSAHGFNFDQADVDEMSMIPCEFCGNPFPTEELFHHQSSCTNDPLSSLAPQFITNQLREEPHFSTSNHIADREERSVPVVNPEQLPIIDNLRDGVEQNWFLLPEESLTREQTMLPCEFCDALFPGDNLCHHQAICDANSEMTPRVMSPAVTTPYLKNKLHLKNRLEQPATVARNHQDSAALHSSDEEIDINTHCNPSPKHENSPQTWTSPYDLRSTLQKYGVEGDRGNSLHLRPHGYSHYVQNSSDSEEEKRIPASLVNRRDSTERTRRTLNQLLHEDDNGAVNDYDLLAHISVANKGKSGPETRTSGSSRHGVTNHGKKHTSNSSNKGAKPVKKTVSARDVRQELDNEGVQPLASISQSRSHARSRVGADQNVLPGSRPRQRSRANYLFSNGTNSLKTDNKVPSRRSGDRS